jgi:hypothetical protein
MDKKANIERYIEIIERYTEARRQYEKLDELARSSEISAYECTLITRRYKAAKQAYEGILGISPCSGKVVG